MTTSTLQSNESTTRELPSGRSVVLRLQDGREELEVRSPEGALEIRITLGTNGPVVHLQAARVEVEATQTLSLDCDRLEVRAREAISLQTDGTLRMTGEEMRVQTVEDIHLNGKCIRLNC